jgi:hypothetical protein
MIGKQYFVRQAAILFGIAKATKDPKTSAALMDKAADLKSKVDGPGAPLDLKRAEYAFDLHIGFRPNLADSDYTRTFTGQSIAGSPVSKVRPASRRPARTTQRFNRSRRRRDRPPGFPPCGANP